MTQKRSKKKNEGIAVRKTAKPRRKTLGDFSARALLLGILLWATVVYLFYGSGISSHIDIAEGQRVPTTVVASVDFECENLTETAFNKDKATKDVSPVFTINPAPLKHATDMTNKLFDRLEQLSVATTNQQQTIRNSIGDLLLSSPLSVEECIGLFPSNHLKIARSTISSNLVTVLSTGVLSDEYRRTLFLNAPSKKLTLRVTGESAFKTLSQQTIYSIPRAINSIGVELLPLTTGENKREELAKLLGTLIETNLDYDDAATIEQRNQAAAAVQPVIQQYDAGTTLARAGEEASAQTIKLLRQHEEKRREEQEVIELLMQVVGNSIYLLSGLLATAVILRIVSPKTAKKPSRLFLLALLSLLTLASARVMLYLTDQLQLIPSSMLMYIVPNALSVLLAGILIGSSSAICLGLWTSFATAILFQQSFDVFALGLLITITATCTARNVHRRASLFRAGLWVCAIKMLFVLISAVLNRPVMPVLMEQLAGALISGMVSTILALLLIPVFEKLFKITTDITLLELSDMGNPLLQKLAIQAPGTYHHSLMVATLAATAAERIGANSLLVRVCAYYHDIGKLAKPEFFTENIQHKENPHDELSPHMSALVITSHVKEGLTLAKRNKLPQPILDAIEQHHGNGLISFFYHKAKTMNEKEAAAAGSASPEPINDSDFRYGGRPAVTKEMAILALADSSEAASRSIEKPTPQKIANLIGDIFTSKIRDGQMDHANLTMAEISEVRDSFIFSLSNMLHGRIPYPKDNENDRTRKTTEAPSAHKESE